MSNTSTSTLKLPITNVYSKSDYTVTLFIGSEQTPVNLLIDSGSSTLAIAEKNYQAKNDTYLVPTTVAQEVIYGLGGWNGPLVNTSISIGENQKITLQSSHIALVEDNHQWQTFGDTDGILGLAYHHLNKSFDLASYFEKEKLTPALTYPWIFTDDHQHNSNQLRAFKKFLWQYPEHDVKPYFTELEEKGLVANKFAFYSKRSSVHVATNKNSISNTAKQEQLLQDPLNHGYLILGGGEEFNELYQGKFKEVPVLHDVYYNVELDSVTVANSPTFIAAPLDKKHLKGYQSNAIIDTGSSVLVLTADIYQYVIEAFGKNNSKFEQLLAPFNDIDAQHKGISGENLNLNEWPDIIFTFKTNKGVENLTCSPETYWQLNFPEYGKACFKIISQLPHWPNQSILGLPLINNYYVVFDRAKNKTGVIKFAKQK